MCQDGGHGAALGWPGLRVEDRAIRLSHPRLQALADEFQQGPINHGYPLHVHQPGVGNMVEAALDIGLYQRAISSVWPIDGEVADRLQRAASGSIAVTALPKVLLIDCRQQL